MDVRIIAQLDNTKGGDELSFQRFKKVYASFLKQPKKMQWMCSKYSE